jgi:hypothetical protein
VAEKILLENIATRGADRPTETRPTGTLPRACGVSWMAAGQERRCNTPCYENPNQVLKLQLSLKVRANQVVKV